MIGAVASKISLERYLEIGERAVRIHCNERVSRRVGKLQRICQYRLPSVDADPNVEANANAVVGADVVIFRFRFRFRLRLVFVSFWFRFVSFRYISSLL